MKMIIFLNKKQIVIETNIKFAMAYWSKRKQENPNITWKLA